MNGLEWVMTVIQHLAAGITARAVEAFWYRPAAKHAAKSFNDRIAAFNSSMPRVLGKVLLASYPELANRILTVSIGSERRSYPVVNLIPNEFARDEILTISHSVSTEHDNAPHSEEFIGILKETGRKLWDNDMFRLLAIGNQHELIFGITRYFKALTSCDRFFFQLVQHLPPKPSDFRLAVLAQRSFVRNWRKDVQGIIMHGQFHHVSAAVGISVFTVIKRTTEHGKADYFYPCIENSNEKMGACDRHVIPSFMFEPMSSSPQDWVKELQLKYQVLREFGEEVAGISELRSMLDFEAAKATILSDPACKQLFALLENGTAVLKTTGLWLDLLRVRPEITCALIINDDEFYLRHVAEFKGSWENNPGVRWTRLTDEAGFKALLSDTEFPLCPPAVAAVVAGRQFALKKLKLEKKHHKVS